MTSDRPYHAALPLQAARDVIERSSGTLFDPRAAAAFLRESNDTLEKISKQTVTVQVSAILAAESFPVLGG
jgi:HD-GYP domain-containing protein (c-di-GMP phosphodiesterase class II)